MKSPPNIKLPTPVYEEFTVENLKTLIPSNLVNQDLADRVNQLMTDDLLKDQFKDNMVSFVSVLSRGQFTPQQYVNAVTYVSYRLMGIKKREAWSHTFPDRYKELLNKGVASKVIYSHSSAYDKSKLVSMITEQTLVQSYVINQHYFQEALETAVDIMRDDEESGKVRVDALGRVLEYTAMPESLGSNKEEIAEKSMDIIQQLANATSQLAKTHAKAIENGASPKQIIQEAIYVDVTDD